MRFASCRACLPSGAAVFIAALAATLLLSSCGGGGGSVSSAPPAGPSAAKPPPAGAVLTTGSSWQWQLRGTLNPRYAVNVYDIDLFNAPQATIDSLKAKGTIVICYFSAGSSESFRPDFAQFSLSDQGNVLANYPDERWLDIRSTNVRTIMQARLDLAKQKGCNGVEPDNVDGYVNNSGFPLDAAAQLDFNRFLLTQAHARSLLAGLKNDVAQISDLAAVFDFAVNEQCHEFNECNAYGAFIALGKPVLNAEYATRYLQNTGGARDALCTAAKAQNLRTLVLPVQLDDSSRFSCD